MENPAMPTTQSDHDMLVTLNVKMDQVNRNIRDLTDGTTVKLTDLDTRLRKVENVGESFTTVKTIVYGMVSLILIGVIGGLLTLVLR
jgi:uncharacterized membrane-anchored protein